MADDGAVVPHARASARSPPRTERLDPRETGHDRLERE
jgi:hypothetical protein